MFVVEASVFFLFLGGYCIWMLFSDRLSAWRDRRQANRVSRFVDALHGQAITQIVESFGPPREQFTGSSGRSIYVWRRPPSKNFPEIRGLLVVTLTVGDDGHVAETEWHRM